MVSHTRSPTVFRWFSAKPNEIQRRIGICRNTILTIRTMRSSIPALKSVRISCAYSEPATVRCVTWNGRSERFVEDQEKQIAVFLPSRETSLEQMDEEKHQFVDERPGPEEQLTQSERLQLLRRALKSLTSAEREVIQSLYFEDLTERQLSELIGVPQKTINDRKRRAISKLRKFFK